MNIYETIQNLSKDKGVSIRKLELDLNFGNGTIKRWLTNAPSVDKVKKVADYFGVTVDYLLRREEKQTKRVEITDDDILLSFDGNEITEHDKRVLENFLQTLIDKDQKMK